MFNLHFHGVYFLIVFDSFILVTIFKKLKFTSFLLFGTHILWDRSSRVLQLPSHQSKSAING